MKKLIIAAFFAGAVPAAAQTSLTLDLEQTIRLANDSSLEAFRTQNMYLSGFWEYRTYRANRLPSLTLDLTPAQYYRDITRRYDSQEDIDVYRTQQSFYAYGNLTVNQNIDLTGGTLYARTSLGYMRNFGANKYTQYTSVPFQIGYSQDLIGYNAFRWERKIEPLKYEKVKKQYLYDAEQVSEQAATYFFQLAMAQAEYDLARDNAASTDTLYRIGRERFKIAAISRADLLTLELDHVNAGNTLQTAASDLKRAMFALASFLDLPKDTQLRLVLPGPPRNYTISVDKALAMARENNPDFLQLRQDVLEAEQEVNRTKVESRFNASISASIGFNQVAEDLGGAYRHPLQQDMVSVSVSTPSSSTPRIVHPSPPKRPVLPIRFLETFHRTFFRNSPTSPLLPKCPLFFVRSHHRRAIEPALLLFHQSAQREFHSKWRQRFPPKFPARAAETPEFGPFWRVFDG